MWVIVYKVLQVCKVFYIISVVYATDHVSEISGLAI